MPEPVLVTEPDSPPPPAQAAPVASGTALPGPGASSAQPPITPQAGDCTRTLEKATSSPFGSPRPRRRRVRRRRLSPARRGRPRPVLHAEGGPQSAGSSAPGSLRGHRAGKSQASANGCPDRRSRGAAARPPRPQSAPRATAAARHPPATPSTSRAAGDVECSANAATRTPHAHAAPGGLRSRPRSFEDREHCVSGTGIPRSKSGTVIPGRASTSPGVRHYRTAFSALTLLMRRLPMPDVDPASIADAVEDGANDEEDLAAAYEALAEDRRNQEMEGAV